MKGKKDMHLLQFKVDDNLFEKWNTFHKNNKSVFNTGQDLFRYAINNIEILAVQNNNLIPKEKAIVEKLEQENIELKKEVHDLKNNSVERKDDDNEIKNMLNELLEEVGVLEILTSSQMIASGNNYRIQEPKKTSIYKEAKEKIKKFDSQLSISSYRKPF